MKLICDRDALLTAFGDASGACPARSPKPILENVKIAADDSGATLTATDLEVGIARDVHGVRCEVPGAAVLPTARFGAILRACRDDELAIEADGPSLVVRGLNAEWTLTTEDPGLFPDVPGFDAEACFVVAPADLKRAIRRTIFATDPESTRYALGGVLFDLADGPGAIHLVATDGRRLARQEVAVLAEGGPTAPETPVVPVKALKLIDRVLGDDDGPARLAFVGSSAVLARTDRATVYSRLVEGRFPKYRDVFPDPGAQSSIPARAGDLLGDLARASIATSEESRGVDLTFESGRLVLEGKASDVGRSRVESLLDYMGGPIEITFDPRYVSDFLKVLDPEAAVDVRLIDGRNAAEFRTEDGLVAIVMPLTRDR